MGVRMASQMSAVSIAPVGRSLIALSYQEESAAQKITTRAGRVSMRGGMGAASQLRKRQQSCRTPRRAGEYPGCLLDRVIRDKIGAQRVTIFGGGLGARCI